LTRRATACYPKEMRALPGSISRVVVAALLLALFAAPLARASAALAAPARHSCCPEAPAQSDSAPPCQQIAPLSCCLEIAVPPAAGDEARPAGLALAILTAPQLEPALPSARFARPTRATEGPPLAPLAQTSVLLL
jgi:hypothetical protein